MPSDVPPVHPDHDLPRANGLALEDLASRQGHAEDARADVPRRRGAHEGRVALAVVEPEAVVDQEEPAILLRPVRPELDRVRVMQAKALDRRDVDAGDVRHGHTGGRCYRAGWTRPGARA